MNIGQAETKTRIDGGLSGKDHQAKLDPRDVLEEVFLLLEDYGPTWYTEEHHNRIVAALLARDY